MGCRREFHLNFERAFWNDTTRIKMANSMTRRKRSGKRIGSAAARRAVEEEAVVAAGVEDSAAEADRGEARVAEDSAANCRRIALHT